jgi:hypothetical protein
MAMTFKVVARPTRSHGHGGLPRAPYVQAVLDTLKSGKAITFSDDESARRAYVATVATLRRRHPEQRVRRNQLTLWVEYRKNGGER